jgi:hypothetical protein
MMSDWIGGPLAKELYLKKKNDWERIMEKRLRLIFFFLIVY